MIMQSVFGVAELMILLSGGSIGIPLSIPPAPEDVQLAHIAPDDCVYYTSWAGTATPDPNSPNHTEQLLAQREVQRLVKQVEQQLQEVCETQLPPDHPARHALQWGKLLLTRSTAVFVSKLEFHDQPVDDDNLGQGANVTLGENSLTVRGALVVNLGAAKKKFAQSLLEMQKTLDNMHEVQLDNRPFTQWIPDPDGIQWTWGFKDDYFILATDKASAAGVIERFGTPIPKWLARVRDQHPLPRRATLTYANLEKIASLATPMADGELVETMGLDELRDFVAVTGLDEHGYVSKTLIEFTPGADGLLARLGGKHLTPEHLAHIPTDSTVAIAGRIDGAELINTVLSLGQQIMPQFPREFAQFEQQIAKELGFRLSDVVRNLGDTWTLHASPLDGGILTGWTLTVSVRKPDELARHQEQLLAYFKNLQGQHNPRIQTVKVLDKEYHSLLVPDDDFVVAPSWYCDDQKLVIALFPQPIQAMLSSEKIETGLSKAPKCARLFESDAGPALVVYADTATLMKIAYPALQVGLRAFLGQMQQEGIELNLTMLPALRAIVQHLEPSLLTVRRTPQGLLIESHRTIPGGSVGAMAPAWVAATIPAIGSARDSAQRNASTNNMRQLILSLANYESAMRQFPPAYSTDAEGKPLLSWRVHILPYLEEMELYQEFHLGEPWDSPHNRKLIARMPDVFRAPGSDVDPGKTNYLAVGGEKGVFGKPTKGKGTKMREITDGSSRTIALVEASDDLAVIWTKPDEFVPEKDNPVRGLTGLRKGVILAGFCDGHVSAVASTIDPEILWAMFTKDGGEAFSGQ